MTTPYDAVNWVADELFRLLARLFTRYGVPIVFLAALTEATVGLGVLVPGVILIFLAGAYATEEGDSLVLILVVSVLGTVMGDSISYVLGRWGGTRMSHTRFGPTLRLGQTLMEGRVKWLIPFYHLNSVTRTVGPFGAGALRMPLHIWMPLDYAGAFIANAVWMGSGAVLGRAVLTDDGTLKQHPALRIALFVAAMAWLVLLQREMERSKRVLRERDAAAADEGDSARGLSENLD